MRVAITVSQGRVSPVFDVSREAAIFEVVEQQASEPLREPLPGDDTLCKARQLASLGIHTLVCGAISNEALEQLRDKGIHVVGFVTGELDAVMRALLAEDLPNPALAMPGCGGGGGKRLRRRCRRGRNP